MWYVGQWSISQPKESRNPDTCYGMDGPGRHYAKGNKPGLEGQGLSDDTCMRYPE